MSYSYKLTRSEIIAAANALEKQLDTVNQTTAEVLKSSTALCAVWKGDASVAFSEEQKKNVQTFLEMEKCVQVLIEALKTAEKRYGDADKSAAALIRSH